MKVNETELVNQSQNLAGDTSETLRAAEADGLSGLVGRELDAAVSRIVMGYIWDESRCRVCGWPVYETIDKGCTAGSCSERPAPERRADAPAHYSTDIAAAMEVVEKIYAAEWAIAIDRSVVIDGSWSVEFSRVNSKHEVCRAYSFTNTLPEAICRAALATE